MGNVGLIDLALTKFLYFFLFVGGRSNDPPLKISVTILDVKFTHVS